MNEEEAKQRRRDDDKTRIDPSLQWWNALGPILTRVQIEYTQDLIQTLSLLEKIRGTKVVCWSCLLRLWYGCRGLACMKKTVGMKDNNNPSSSFQLFYSIQDHGITSKTRCCSKLVINRTYNQSETILKPAEGAASNVGTIFPIESRCCLQLDIQGTYNWPKTSFGISTAHRTQ